MPNSSLRLRIHKAKLCGFESNTHFKIATSLFTKNHHFVPDRGYARNSKPRVLDLSSLKILQLFHNHIQQCPEICQKDSCMLYWAHQVFQRDTSLKLIEAPRRGSVFSLKTYYRFPEHVLSQKYP